VVVCHLRRRRHRIGCSNALLG